MAKDDNPRLDRLVQFDERSREFPIRALVAGKPRSFTWSVNQWFDQKSEGACVGFAWAHEMVARPKVARNITESWAQELYRTARTLDEWPGEDYEGTSVLAGAKACKNLGMIKEYRWAFGLEDLRLAIGSKGPAVLGINWYEGMFNPDADGYLRPTGKLAGGHAILAYANSERYKRISVWNSWGQDFGRNGAAYISHEDLARLLGERGEACIPVSRGNL